MTISLLSFPVRDSFSPRCTFCLYCDIIAEGNVKSIGVAVVSVAYADVQSLLRKAVQAVMKEVCLK